MKKNSSMQGTLNKLFGKKNSNNNSLYVDNPPWMKPQGVKKTSVDYHDDIHNSFSFLDDSGTATLKSRPGPRVRPTLQFSTSNTDTQGLAVPTPSVPSGYSDNASIGNGPKMNGNYRMCSSVGDLRLTNYYEHLDEDIPAPPSMPPPPPPSMPPPPPPTKFHAAPPQESPPSSTISSPPVSPSVPDFIPPTPYSSATTVPNYEPSTYTSTVSQQRQTDNSKWKSEGAKDMPISLPNRFSLNTAAFQHNHGQTTSYVDPHSSLPKTFKVAPPAPMRTSSIQLQEQQNINYSTEPPQSPLPSSFNPSVQAKLYSVSNPRQQALNDALNKRRSMLIMEDLQDLSQKDHATQSNASITDSTASGSLSLKSSMNTKAASELHTESKTGILSDDTQLEPGFNDYLQKRYAKINANGSESPLLVSGKNKDGSKRPMSSIEFSKITFNEDAYKPNGHKSTKDAVKIISVKPILTDMSLSNTANAAIINHQAPPTPPSMPPPPPPTMTPPKPPAVPPPPPPPPVTVTPQNTYPTPNFVAPPPAPPLVASMPPVPQASPLLPPKPKTISASSTSQVIIPPPPPPKAPPAPPPPLPSQTGTSTPEPQLPLLEALQEKQRTLKQISKMSIEVRPAQVSSINVTSDDDQKARVGKIKGELEALFSPKKDEKLRDLKNSRPSLEVNKKSTNGNTTQKKGGENTIVNSLMMKVPHIPSVPEKIDVDEDTSDWIPKSNNTNFQIPEPDYLPVTPIKTMENPAYSDLQSDIAKPLSEISSKPASPLKATGVVSIKQNDIPTYKPHRERKASAESLALNKLPLAVSETTPVVSSNKDEASAYPTTSLKTESLIKQEEGINTHPVTGEQVENNSPMALLLAAKKRAQKGSRSVGLERSNLPKMSVSSGLVTSSLTSQYNDDIQNTFVVVPKKENEGQFGQEQVTSFSSKSSSHLGNVSSSSKWTDGEFPSSSVNILGLKPSDEKGSSMHVGEKNVVQVPTKDRNEEFWKVKSSVNKLPNSTNMSNSIDAYTFNISSVPSPVPASKTYEDFNYGIIPPPAQFMSTSPSTDINMHQTDRLYVNESKSDLRSEYQWNNKSDWPLRSQTISNNSDFNKYTSDNYSTGISRDPHKVSLIKKRLYMPDPESSGSYGKNTHSLRSSALPVSYGHMHSLPTSSSMAPEPRRSSNPSRYMPQGRRVSSENINQRVPTMTDMKYKPQNPEYGNSMSRQQSTYQPGMTFTVRPGTRQPISQMYQAGYL
ncbi:PREDICTED: uncharacterized protein C6orf132-like [Nanorana parkeri]|uniref:uncharacterized protein C6orf132-like n=1 Tax=Nanorana parkeri TaxID=125878 RepID=UPI0008546A9A|nr:PREDICTED: uncharacterized protein C6orf132-like [Nanorana parkeri]